MIQFFCDESAEAGMRGAFVDQGGLFSYIAPEARVPVNLPAGVADDEAGVGLLDGPGRREAAGRH
jgi:hypothetical protein